MKKLEKEKIDIFMAGINSYDGRNFAPTTQDSELNFKDGKPAKKVYSFDEFSDLESFIFEKESEKKSPKNK